VAKKRLRRHTAEFRAEAVERLKGSDNIVALSKELGVHRRLLYKWLEDAELASELKQGSESRTEHELRIELARVKRLLADKTLEVDFFKGALQKIEARRQTGSRSGATASTTESGS
jgi:transposase-like protein